MDTSRNSPIKIRLSLACLAILLGPDGTLAGLLGKIDKSVTVVSIKDLETLEAALPAIQG